MEGFFDVLASIFIILSGILLTARMLGALTYSELDKTIDSLNGVVKTYPITTPGIVFIVCLAWIAK